MLCKLLNNLQESVASHDNYVLCGRVYRIAGNFRGCKFSLFGSQRNFHGFNFRVNANKPHPPIGFAPAYTGAWEFIPVLIFALTTLPSKNAKICTPRKFPAIRYLYV